MFWFLDAGNDETLGRLSWPASKKRQSTKSREVWHPAVQRVLWGSYVGGDLDGGRGASARRNIHGTFKQTGLRYSFKTTLSLRYGGVDVTRRIRVPACQMILAVLDHALHADNT